jgi:putative membrane protein
MERKLYRGIMTPSMVIVVVLGVWIFSLNSTYYFSQNWMLAKLALVALLVGYHFMCGSLLKKFKQEINDKGHVFYRWFNEVPVLFLVAITILVVVRPF